MKKTKKEIYFFLVIFLISFLPIFAYGNETEILMFLWNGETKAEEGFKDTLAEELPKQNIIYTVFDIHKSTNRLEELINTTDETQYDLIYTYGSKITSKVAQQYTNTPIVFDIVFDPIGYEITESWEEKQSNLTGASNSIPIDIQIQKIQEIFGKGPIGFIYNPLDQRSVNLKENFESYLKNIGEDIIPFQFEKNYRSLRTYLNRNRNRLKCIYLPSEWLISRHIKRILSQINRRKIPTCVTNKSYLKKRALLCITAKYYEVGKMAGKLASQIIEGTKPTDLPIKRPTETDIKLYANAYIVKRFKIYLPKGSDINYIK